MDDLISRQAALEAIEHYYNDKKYIKRSRTILSAICLDMKSTIDSLPSAQPEHRWIPVAERLPEGIGQAIIQTSGGAIHEVFYKGKNDYGHEVWMRLDGDIYWDDEVVAWMPLPEPYKENSDG